MIKSALEVEEERERERKGTIANFEKRFYLPLRATATYIQCLSCSLQPRLLTALHLWVTVKTIKAALNFSAIQVLNNAPLSARERKCANSVLAKSSVGGFSFTAVKITIVFKKKREKRNQTGLRQKRGLRRIDLNIKKTLPYDSKIDSNAYVSY